MSRSAAVLAAALLAACCGPRGSDIAEPAVVIHNRTGEALSLCRVVRDGFGETEPLGSGERIALHLPPGRYALQIGSQGRRVPLPLPAAELGFVPPAVTEVTVWPWPAARAGWCWIPPGLGLRGDDLGIGQEDERPVSTPELPGFWLAERETTNAQYVEFLNALPRGEVSAEWLDLQGHKCRVQWDDTAKTFATDAPNLPVVTVAWDGAVAYCRWLTEKTGVVHRLPSETEWEKAARGAGSRVYAYGDTYRTAAANQESGRLLETACFAANELGLFDMTGNAFEWTSDAFARGADDGYRALRGGSFVLDGIFVRNSMRMRLRPDVRADDVGFRVLQQNFDVRIGPVPGH